MAETIARRIRRERERLRQQRDEILNQQQELEHRLDALNHEFETIEGNIDASADSSIGTANRHVIYLICGTERRKIGVTRDLAGRMEKYRHEWGLRGRHLPIFRVIETLIACTDREATIRKQYWSAYYDLPRRLTCPYCGRAGRAGRPHGALQRWHFDNCRHRPPLAHQGEPPSASTVRPPGWTPITRPA